MTRYKVSSERVISPQQAANKCLAVVVKFKEGARAYMPLHWPNTRPELPGMKPTSVVREIPIGFQVVASHSGCPDTWETIADWVEYHASNQSRSGTRAHVLLCCDTAEELMDEITKEVKCRS